jgi:flagellar motor switch protein FliG
MNNQTLPSPHRQLRDVAILVASLDDAMAQSLLDSMPSKDAAAILAEVDALEYVDPREQREIAEKFRSSITPPRATKVDGVELDASLLAKLEEQDLGDYSSAPLATQQPLETLSDSESSAIVDMLATEHPQTIAIVFSRIEASKAAALMTKLSVSLQGEVLGRLGNLDEADEQTVRVVESQLASWIEQQRQREHRQTAGMELVQRILEHTPAMQRKTILTHMGKNTPIASKQITERSSTVRPTQKTPEKLLGPQLNPGLPTYRMESANVRSRPILRPSETPSVPEIEISADPLSELEKTDETILMTALSQTDRTVGALALAEASDALMKRVLQGLPRRQAKKIRQQLRTLGPTKLSDMLAAQQRLLHKVRQLALP